MNGVYIHPCGPWDKPVGVKEADTSEWGYSVFMDEVDGSSVKVISYGLLPPPAYPIGNPWSVEYKPGSDDSTSITWNDLENLVKQTFRKTMQLLI